MTLHMNLDEMDNFRLVTLLNEYPDSNQNETLYGSIITELELGNSFFVMETDVVDGASTFINKEGKEERILLTYEVNEQNYLVAFTNVDLFKKWRNDETAVYQKFHTKLLVEEFKNKLDNVNGIIINAGVTTQFVAYKEFF